ncbi:hypothetical protein [Nocardia sp. NPDC057440]|uniref:hypothetical protein n=1 Tax=Nocardia sp. NPDC057440 TaxID=3346134 RepID=UPI00366D9BDC
MIVSWTDPAGVIHHADEHSKAYRKRAERDVKPAESVADEAPAESKRPRTVTVKAPEGPSS